MKKYRIYFWHGFSESVAERLDNIVGVLSCDGEDNRTEYFYEGSLDHFAEAYERLFTVIDNEVICVTQYNNFGQR